MEINNIEISQESVEALQIMADTIENTLDTLVNETERFCNVYKANQAVIGPQSDLIISIVGMISEMINGSVDAAAILPERIRTTAEEIHRILHQNFGHFAPGSHAAYQESFYREKNGARRYPTGPSALHDEFLNKFSEDRRRAINDAFANANPFIVNILNKYSYRLERVLSCSIFKKEGCSYYPGQYEIHMDEDLNSDGNYLLNSAAYGDILKHELGHFVDDIFQASGSQKFLNAIDTEQQRFSDQIEGHMNIRDMLDDAFSTGVCNDRYVSDIISAMLSRNKQFGDTYVSAKYQVEMVEFYKHEQKYWSTQDASGIDMRMDSKEVFANYFAIYTECSQKSVNFIERWFHESTEEFKEILIEEEKHTQIEHSTGTTH